MFEPEPPPTPPVAAGPLALGLLAGVFAAFMLFGATAQLLNLSWGLWFGEVFVFVGLPFVVLRVVGAAKVPTAGLGWRLAAFGTVVGLVNYVSWAVPLMSLAEHLFPKSVVDAFDGSAIFKNQTPFEMALILGGVALAAPLGEEYFFRGALQPRLVQWLGPGRAVFMTALIFSAFHFDPVGFLARLELGVVFGLLALRTRSIWPGVFAHAANNTVSSVAYFVGLHQVETGAVDPDEPLDWRVVAALFVVGNALLAAVVAWAWRARPEWLRPPTDDEAPQPRVPLARALGPWLLGAVAALAALLLVDLRGVQLNVYDAVHPTAKSARDALAPLRARARQGDATLEDYFSAQRATTGR